jgi:hypothetical protein
MQFNTELLKTARELSRFFLQAFPNFTFTVIITRRIVFLINLYTDSLGVFTVYGTLLQFAPTGSASCDDFG